MMDWNESYVGDGTDTTPLDEQLLADVLTISPGKALDLGCGAGGNAIGLALRGWNVTGIDSASKAIDSARLSAANSGVDVTFQVGDVTNWKPVDVYDLIISSYALPPKGPQRDAVFATAKAALAPGGMLVIGDWDAKNTDWGAPDIFVTVDELTSALDSLEIVRIESVATQPHDHPNHHGVKEHGDLGNPQSWVVIAVARRKLD